MTRHAEANCLPAAPAVGPTTIGTDDQPEDKPTAGQQRPKFSLMGIKVGIEVSDGMILSQPNDQP